MKKPLSHRTLNLIIILSSLFLLLSLFVSFIPYFGLDLQITKSLQSINLPWFDSLMFFVSFIGFSPYIELIILASSLLLYFLHLKLEAFLSLFSTAIGAGLGALLKIIIDRARPDETLVSVVTRLNDKSFPSNHVLVYSILFGFLLYLSIYKIKNNFVRSPIATISIFFIVTIGLSRIYLGAHWASDILGGYLLGLIFLACTLKIYRIIQSDAQR